MSEFIETKTILSRVKGAPDPYFGIAYNMNLYRGCQHQCIYCDSRSKVYGIENFAHIQIKKNAHTLLEKALRKRIKKGTIGTGSMNDPYMPIESDLRHTRSALEIIAKYKFPVHILTKSDLVLRDTDILKDISKIYSAVSFTITSGDDQLSNKIEPGAPVSSLRFKAMKKLAVQGLYTGVLISPVLPFITDSEKNIAEIIALAKDNGAKYILGWMGMTQREGQREFYYRALDKSFPGLKDKYIRYFGNDYSCSPENAKNLYTIFSDTSNKLGLSNRMIFYAEKGPKQLGLFD